MLFIINYVWEYIIMYAKVVSMVFSHEVFFPSLWTLVASFNRHNLCYLTITWSYVSEYIMYAKVVSMVFSHMFFPSLRTLVASFSKLDLCEGGTETVRAFPQEWHWYIKSLPHHLFYIFVVKICWKCAYCFVFVIAAQDLCQNGEEEKSITRALTLFCVCFLLVWW